MKQRHELKENIRFSSFHGYTGRCIRSVSPTLPLLLSWELYYLVLHCVHSGLLL
jgi:hypothetical protein